jgi:C-terminal processing protease CtpA/Prc
VVSYNGMPGALLLSMMLLLPREASTVLDRDVEFRDGSRVRITAPAAETIDRLATLGKMWGFLKYHHPRVTSGQLHWDYELFRVLPRVLASGSRKSFQKTLTAWVRVLGEPPPCSPCATDPVDAWIRPDLEWTRDRERLGDELVERLQRIHGNRPAGGARFYMFQEPEYGEPRFDHELPYATRFPDPGYRLLALFRYWNIIQYWSPYRDVIGSSWHDVLAEFIPRVLACKDRYTYALEMTALAARLNDGHARLSPDVRPPLGDCLLPVPVRFIEGRAVVVDEMEGSGNGTAALRRGDVIESLDGRPVESLIGPVAPYYAASNDTARLKEMSVTLTRGACRDVEVSGTRAEGPFKVTIARRPTRTLALRAMRAHDLPGETYQRLSPDVAYIKLSAIFAGEVAELIQRASGARGLVVDVRNYPASMVFRELGERLVAEPTPFARFTYPDTGNPGAFTAGTPRILPPRSPAYRGKVVILVDEVTLSAAEFTAMALRAAPGSVVVGSPTAGADGNLAMIPLPGGLETMISGLGVFYPDGRPTQRVGLVPDVEARPTIQGIREGRDEVLEAGIRQILRDSVTEEQIRSMARPAGAGSPR